MKQVIILLAFCCISFNGDAQGYFWESAGKTKRIKYLTVDAGLGLRMFSGDIQQRGSLFNPLKLAYGIGARYQFRPHVGVGLSLAGRGYKGYAEHGGYPDAVDEMNGSLWEGALSFQYSVLKWTDFTKRSFTDRDPVSKGNIYVGVGGGASLFNASFTSRKYRTENYTDSLGRDSTVAFPVDASGSGGGFAFFVPVSFGLRYRFNPTWSMGLEMRYDVYFSDNLDGLQRKNNDGMSLFMLRVSYSFAQDKTAA
ncbi:MAG: hypothetical protein WEC59_06460, partial [Salibacteraceae bacterium]